MPTLLLERAPALGEGLEHDPRRGLGDAVDTGRADAHGRLTLDELITGVWEGLAVRGTVHCPVCDGRMAAEPLVETAGEHDRLAGLCSGCGAQLT